MGTTRDPLFHSVSCAMAGSWAIAFTSTASQMTTTVDQNSCARACLQVRDAGHDGPRHVLRLNHALKRSRLCALLQRSTIAPGDEVRGDRPGRNTQKTDIRSERGGERHRHGVESRLCGAVRNIAA